MIYKLWRLRIVNMEIKEATRIVIIDDQTILREVLAATLAQNPNYRIIGQAGEGLKGVELCTELQPDLVLLDVMLPGLNGAEALSRILENCPRTKVLVVSGYDKPAPLHRLLKEGVNGIVHKNSALTCLMEAVEKVLSGEAYYCPVMQPLIVTLLTDPTIKRETISRREREVLQLLAEGHTAKEIAERLSLSTKTVENHRQNIMVKLGIHDVVGLTHYAIKSGLIAVR